MGLHFPWQYHSILVILLDSITVIAVHTAHHHYVFDSAQKAFSVFEPFDCL